MLKRPTSRTDPLPPRSAQPRLAPHTSPQHGEKDAEKSTRISTDCAALAFPETTPGLIPPLDYFFIIIKLSLFYIKAVVCLLRDTDGDPAHGGVTDCRGKGEKPHFGAGGSATTPSQRCGDPTRRGSPRPCHTTRPHTSSPSTASGAGHYH